METDFSRMMRAARGGRKKVEVERGTGVHRSSLLRMENGERLISDEHLHILCNFYGIDEPYARLLRDRAYVQRRNGGESLDDA